MSAWKQVDGLAALLAFSHGKAVAAQSGDCLLPREILLPDDVRRAKVALVTFSDGSEMVCVSAVEYTGYCDTCADEQAWTGFFVRGASQGTGEA